MKDQKKNRAEVLGIPKERIDLIAKIGGDFFDNLSMSVKNPGECIVIDSAYVFEKLLQNAQTYHLTTIEQNFLFFGAGIHLVNSASIKL